MNEKPAALAILGSVAATAMLSAAIPSAPSGPTRDEMKAALHDPDVPDGVKVAIRTHLYGTPAQRARIIKMNTPEFRPNPHSGRVTPKPLQATNKPRRPKGMSGRQWKIMRRENVRTNRRIVSGQASLEEIVRTSNNVIVR